MTTAASCRETHSTRSDCSAHTTSPSTRAGDSGGSPSRSGEFGWAATEWKVITCGTPQARATGSAATPDIQWWEWIRSWGSRASMASRNSSTCWSISLFGSGVGGPAGRRRSVTDGATSSRSGWSGSVRRVRKSTRTPSLPSARASAAMSTFMPPASAVPARSRGEVCMVTKATRSPVPGREG